MKKICFFSGGIHRSGGTERVTSLIASELSKRGWDVCILSLFNGKKSFFKLDTKIKLYTLYDKPVNGILYLPQIILKIRKFVKQNKIDIFIDVDTILSFYSVFALRGLNVKHISWEHFNFYSTLGTKRRVCGRKLAAKYADQIITLTEEDKNYFLENLNVRAKIDYIYNPNPYQNNGKSNCENKIALAVGRLVDIKGFDRLLKIWSKIEKQDGEWQLKIIGSGEKKDELLKLSEKLGLKRVEFIANTNKVDEYYKEASIYLMTSRFEGLPMTLIEAQSFGLPIISFNIKTGPSDIIDNNINGFLIDEGNEEEFISRFFELAKSEIKRKEFGRKAEESSNKFKIDKIVNNWELLLG